MSINRVSDYYEFKEVAKLLCCSNLEFKSTLDIYEYMIDSYNEKLSSNNIYLEIIESLEILKDYKVHDKYIMSRLKEGIEQAKVHEVDEILKELLKGIEEEIKTFNSSIGIDQIEYSEPFNYIKANNKYCTFLKVEIMERLDLLREETLISYLENFYGINIQASSEYSIHYFNKKMNFQKEIKKLNDLINGDKFPNEKIKNALLSDIKNYQSLEEKIKHERVMYIQIKEKDLEDLVMTTNNLLNCSRNILISHTSDTDFNFIINKLYYEYLYLKPSSSQTYGYNPQKEKYYKILNIKGISKNQNELYLNKLVHLDLGNSIESQLSINVKKLTNSESKRLVSKAYKRNRGRNKFDKSDEGRKEQLADHMKLDTLIDQLRENPQEVILEPEFYYILKSDNYKELEKIERYLNKEFEGKLSFVNIPFSLEYHIKSIGNLQTDNRKHSIQMTINDFSFHFAYNFINYQEKNGMDVCLNNKSIVRINFFMKNSLKQSSSGYIFGASGSGKSTAMKAMFTDNALKGNYTYVIDQDNEFTGLINALGGQVITFSNGGKSFINPLKLEANVKADQQITIFLEIIKVLAGEGYSSGIENIISAYTKKLYEKKNGEEFIVENILELIKNDISIKEKLTEKSSEYSEYNLYKKDYFDTVNTLTTIIERYPLFNRKTNVKLKKRNISFNIYRCKDNEKLLNATMLLTFNFMNRQKLKNKLQLQEDSLASLNEKIEEVLIRLEELEVKYNKFPMNFIIKNYQELSDNDVNNMKNILLKIRPNILNEIDDSEQYLKELHSMFKREYYRYLVGLYEQNRKNILIQIDEFHRMINNDQVMKYVLEEIRESRKYEAGIFLASQNINDILNINVNGKDLVSTLWALLPYKFIFKQDISNKAELEAYTELSERQINHVLNANKGEGIVILGKNIYPYDKKISREYLDLFGGGL